VAGAAHHRLYQRNEVVHGDRHGVGIAEDNLARGVADQQQRHPDAVEDRGDQGVVGGQHHEPLALLLGLLDVVHGHPLAVPSFVQAAGAVRRPDAHSRPPNGLKAPCWRPWTVEQSDPVIPGEASGEITSRKHHVSLRNSGYLKRRRSASMREHISTK
jgi:hypothetical protein